MRIEDIISVVCDCTGVERDILLTKTRKRYVSTTKKLIYYFACYCTKETLADIGRITANEPHDLVIFGKKKIIEWLRYKDISDMVGLIKTELSKIEPLPDFSYQNYYGIRYNNMKRQFFMAKAEAEKKGLEYDHRRRQYQQHEKSKI